MTKHCIKWQFLGRGWQTCLCPHSSRRFFLPGFNGTFHRQGAVDPVVDRLLWTEALICWSACRNVKGSQTVRPKLLTVTLWVMTVCSASEEICSKLPTLLASASLKMRATSNDSLLRGKDRNVMNVWSVGSLFFLPQTSYELKHMLPSCRMEDRMAQMVEIWSACKPMVSKQRIKSWKSCLSCFPLSSQEPPLRKTVEKWQSGTKDVK